MKKLFFRRTYLQAFFFATLLSTLVGWTQEAAKQTQDPQSASKPSPEAKPNLTDSDLTPKPVEDFSTPVLEPGTRIGPTEVLDLGVTDDPPFTRDLIRATWRPQDPIDLYIVKPVGVKKPPVILYLYSYPKENDQYLNRDFCKFVTKNGFAAVGFVAALTGQRYNGRPMKEWFVSELQYSLASSAHDVQMILDYLATRGDLDMDRVGMFGDGSGAAIAILAAAVDPRIKTLDLLDPWGDWPDWIAKSTRIPEKERPGFLKPEWLAGVAPLDPVKWLPELKTPKIRIQFVKTVDITPVDAQKKIEAAAPPQAQIVHYDDLAVFRGSVAGGTGFDWIKQQMQEGTAPEYRAAGQAQGSSKPPDHSRQ